jgi:hypothetical protein
LNGATKFKRSGVVTVAAGTSSLAVTLSPVAIGSMIIATAQQNTSMSLKAAAPTTNAFTIYLTGNAPTGGLKVLHGYELKSQLDLQGSGRTTRPLLSRSGPGPRKELPPSLHNWVFAKRNDRLKGRPSRLVRSLAPASCP